MRVLLVLILLFATAVAHAQEPALDAFLEQRVTEELAADGILLSRLGVTLDVEVIGDKLLVSLIDATTGRASASTKVDEVPADRDAAVASVTQVVANLAAQLTGPAVETPVEPAPVPVPEPVVDTAAAEAEYREQAIGFGDAFIVTASQNHVSVRRQWSAHKGSLRVPLSGTAFYNEIGRPDLAAKYRRRKIIKWTSFGVVVVSAGALVGVYVAASKGLDACDLGDDACYDDVEKRALVGTIAVSGVALIGTLVYYWYRLHPHPISEGEAKRLAGEHNEKLRESLRLAPYVSYDDGGGGGLSLSGRF